MAVKRVTRTELNRVTNYWQSVLRLKDWEVAVEMVPPSRIQNQGFGVSYIDLLSRRTTIHLAEYSGHSGSPAHDYSWQETLVHELLHCHFEPFMCDEGQDGNLAQEQALNMLASAFLSLHAGR